MTAARQSRCVSILLTSLILLQNAPLYAQEQAAEQPKKLNIVIIEGDGAINNIRQRVVREPIVQVEDENRKPVGGAVVTFLLPNQGAGATFSNGARSLTVVTDETGRAIGRGLQPNNVSGNWQMNVNASYQGQTASTVLSQSNVVAATVAAGAGISAKLIAVLAIAGAAVAAGTVAATRGGNDNGNGGRAVVVPGTPTVGGPR